MSQNDIEIREANEKGLALGRWLGRHDAFHAISSRCSAADAETLRQLRDSGDYKASNLNWDDFCRQYVGLSRPYVDRLIHRLEEFGPNFFRLSELVDVSPDTYRLLAPAVSDAGLCVAGQTIELKPENRQQILAAVETVRGGSRREQKPAPGFQAALKRLQAAIEAAERHIGKPGDRLTLCGRLHDESQRIDAERRPLRR
jgi:hypothetical protein